MRALAHTAAVLLVLAAAVRAQGPGATSEPEVFGYGIATPGELEVVAEIASGQMREGRWDAGGDVRVTATHAGAAPMVGRGHIPPGARAALVRLPLDPADSGPWRVAIHVSAGAAALDATVSVSQRSGMVVGQALVSRADAGPQAMNHPVAQFQFRRNERLHVEWPLLAPVSQPVVRLLDRSRQVLVPAIPVSERVDGSQRWLMADLTLALFGEGDYLLEIAAGNGPETERRLLAFRVIR